MNAADKCLTIGVTGLNANDNPGPGIAVIRALRAHYGDDIKIIGLAYESLEPGIYMEKLVDYTYQIPYPTAGAAVLLERIEWINEQVGLTMIIPNFDSELYNFIKIAPQLERVGIKTFLPTHAQLAARDKVNLHDLGLRHNFKIPAYCLLNSVADITKAADELSYPLVMKGRFYEAQIVNSYDAAQKVFYELSSRWGMPVIAQQYIKGTEINVAGLGDAEGNLISAVPMRKLYITDKGKAWAGITIEDAELIELARHFAGSIKWKGGFELEIMKDTDGNFFIIEINPRFPAWIYLAVAAGQNQPATLVKMAMGEQVNAYSSYTCGKMFIRHSWDEVVDISRFQQFSAFGELENLTS
jgi:carbamoyl-phosphate synthase large subunit